MTSQAHLVTVISILFTALACVVVCLRLFARGFIIKAMGLDDYLIVVAWLLSCAFTVCTILAMRHAVGQYLIEGGMENLQAFLLGLWLSGVFYPASQGFIKVSICWFYTRLGHECLKRVSYYIIALVVAQTIAFALSSAFHCSPKEWAHNPICLLSCSDSIEAFMLASGALNILIDVLTYALPIPVVLKLQMPSKQKAYTIVILCLVRLVYGARPMRFPPEPVSIAGTFYWTSIEMNLAIVAVSVPSFKAIASRLYPQLIGGVSPERAPATLDQRES
ncbi:hypothetical protein BBP40_003789 [Aspergillus hancockii]|nr:hypothetical protein BBP40_003789 [Aspergillus hancockii]